LIGNFIDYINARIDGNEEMQKTIEGYAEKR
jgi:hypothetical protein